VGKENIVLRQHLSGMCLQNIIKIG